MKKDLSNGLKNRVGDAANDTKAIGADVAKGADAL